MLEIKVDAEHEALTEAQFNVVEPIIVKMMNQELTVKKARSQIIEALNAAGLPLVKKAQ